MRPPQISQTGKSVLPGQTICLAWEPLPEVPQGKVTMQQEVVRSWGLLSMGLPRCDLLSPGSLVMLGQERNAG